MLISVQNLKLEEEKKKRIRNLDPWKTHYQEGNQEEGQENQIQNFLLQHIHQLQPPSKNPSRLSGQIVPIHGGHIVRATGRKDRHSKVCTAKGLRDRRVRLAAHTAIQFYDVQDRLGYDRPSKAIDWLMKNAKAAIDQLDELPPWQPNNIPADFQKNQTCVLEPISTSTATFPINSQDLRLSLQSFQDTTHNVFTGSPSNLPFDSNAPINPWNVADNMFGQNQFFTQREPLQSSNLSFDNASGNQMHHSLFHDFGFGSSSIDFSGFRVPMRIQSKEEEEGDISDKQNSASASHY